jgi:HK97 gp10 family phage protein
MIEFEGIDELLEELEAIGADIEKLKNKALIAGADLLKERMREEVYRHGLHKRTGTAEKSIDRTNPKNGEIFVGNTPDGFYLYFHEFGFWNTWADRYIPPRPFASIAYEQSKDDVLDKMAEVLREGLGMK